MVQYYVDIQLHKSLKLQDVLFVPSFKHNLLSVSKLSKCNQIKFIFFLNYCALQDLKTDQHIVVGKATGQLYLLDSKSFVKQEDEVGHSLDIRYKAFTNACLETKTIDMSMWHQRLGHPSNTVIRHLPFNKNKEKLPVICDVCHFSKQTKLPFPSSSTNTKYIFKLLHLDVWGPYRQRSLIGARFFSDTGRKL